MMPLRSGDPMSMGTKKLIFLVLFPCRLFHLSMLLKHIAMRMSFTVPPTDLDLAFSCWNYAGPILAEQNPTSPEGSGRPGEILAGWNSGLMKTK